MYGEGAIAVAGDAVISNCSALLPTNGEGGGIFVYSGTVVELRDRAKVIECQAQGNGGCISAPDIRIVDHAHVGHCIAVNSQGAGAGGCLFALSQIVISDFATLTHCYADYSSAVFAENSTILLSGNTVVSDCTAVVSGAVLAASSNTTVVIQDNATISRAYSGFYGNIVLLDGASLRMTGRASIHECVSDLGSAIFARLGSLAIDGQNKIFDCSGVACCQAASLPVAKQRLKEHVVGSISCPDRLSWRTGSISKIALGSKLARVAGAFP